jgi:hypothetical protein
MEPREQRYRHAGGWTAVMFLGVFAISLGMVACHVDDHWHVHGVHSTGTWEFYCIDLQTDEVTLQYARVTLAATLLDPFGWDTRDTLTFDDAAVECEDTALRELYEIEIRIHDTGDNAHCSLGACAHADGSCTHHGDPDHCNHTKSHIHIQAGHIDNAQLVAHEVGHTIGFRDPEASNEPDPNAGTCVISLNGWPFPVWSVMHAAEYCSQVAGLAGPTDFDLASFDANVAANVD